MQARRTGYSVAALLLSLLLCIPGCVNPEDRPIVHPDSNGAGPNTRVEVVYETHFTIRNVEVEVPDYILIREELFILAVQEIDNLNVHIHLPRWILRIVPPGKAEGVNREEMKITVAWRAEDHEPQDQMLPNLAKLVDQAAFPE